LVDLFSEDTNPEQLAHPTSPSSCTNEDDLLTQDAVARYDRFSPAQEVILRSPPDSTPPMAVDPDC